MRRGGVGPRFSRAGTAKAAPYGIAGSEGLSLTHLKKIIDRDAGGPYACLVIFE